MAETTTLNNIKYFQIFRDNIINTCIYFNDLINIYRTTNSGDTAIIRTQETMERMRFFAEKKMNVDNYGPLLNKFRDTYNNIRNNIIEGPYTNVGKKLRDDWIEKDSNFNIFFKDGKSVCTIHYRNAYAIVRNVIGLVNKNLKMVPKSEIGSVENSKYLNADKEFFYYTYSMFCHVLPDDHPDKDVMNRYALTLRGGNTVNSEEVKNMLGALVETMGSVLNQRVGLDKNDPEAKKIIDAISKTVKSDKIDQVLNRNRMGQTGTDPGSLLSAINPLAVDLMESLTQNLPENDADDMKEIGNNVTEILNTQEMSNLIEGISTNSDNFKQISDDAAAVIDDKLSKNME